jgi:hypothetical protein
MPAMMPSCEIKMSLSEKSRAEAAIEARAASDLGVCRRVDEAAYNGDRRDPARTVAARA